jgi:hypothetical protein
MQSHEAPSPKEPTMNVNTLKEMLECLHYEVSEVRGPRGDVWLQFRIGEKVFPLDEASAFTAYLRTGADNYLSLHVIVASLRLDWPCGAWVASMCSEINYRNDVVRVGIDPATGDLVATADCYLADIAPTPAFLARMIKALRCYASCAADVVSESKVVVEDEGAAP